MSFPESVTFTEATPTSAICLEDFFFFNVLYFLKVRYLRCITWMLLSCFLCQVKDQELALEELAELAGTWYMTSWTSYL